MGVEFTHERPEKSHSEVRTCIEVVSSRRIKVFEIYFSKDVIAIVNRFSNHVGDQLLRIVVCLDWIEPDSSVVRIHSPLCLRCYEEMRDNGHTLADLRDILRTKPF